MSEQRRQQIRTRLETLREDVREWCLQYGRDPGEVAILAVSKRFPVSDIQAAVAAGQQRFGESYLSEALAKQERLASLGLEWHFIGPLQSNKTRRIAERFDWVHSVDRLKLARRLSEQRPAGLRPLNVCIQVNVSGEATKSGCEPAAVTGLAHAVAELPGLRLRGLMTLPAPSRDFAEQRRAFARLRGLREALMAQGLALDTLSMGMSGDMEAAIAEGSTLLRIGSGIFGPRPAD